MSARDRKTAPLAVTAAALALVGLSLAAWARWSAAGVVDGARAEATVVADRLGGLLSTAIATARVRGEGLAAMPTVRAAIETDVATVRDMARAEGFVFAPAQHEVIEIFQVAPHKRPLSLLRAPETSRTLAIARANEVRVDEEGGALVVTVAVPSQPLLPSYPRNRARSGPKHDHIVDEDGHGHALSRRPGRAAVRMRPPRYSQREAGSD